MLQPHIRHALESDNVRSFRNDVGIRQLTDGRLVVTDSRVVTPRAGCVTAFDGVACSGANTVIAFPHNGDDSYVDSTSLATILISGAGNDRLHTGGQAGPSLVTFSGREGIDTVSYASAARGVNVLKSGAADDGRPGDRDNIFADVEDVIGSRFADNLTGSAGNDLFSGLGGDDTLTGGAGLDTFSMSAGADGADRIFGGARRAPGARRRAAGRPDRHPTARREAAQLRRRALVDRASRLERRGRTVRATLGVRIDPSLAGRKLSIDVEAADTEGRRQLERNAGTIRVAE